MSIVLDHTIAPARDKVVSARFFARIFGLEFDADAVGHFAPVRVNDSLTIDFADSKDFESYHYAFKVDEEEFDAIFSRMKAENLAYGSGPFSLEDGRINHRRGGRGLYFQDPNGHVLEIMTVAETGSLESPIRDQ